MNYRNFYKNKLKSLLFEQEEEEGGLFDEEPEEEQDEEAEDADADKDTDEDEEDKDEEESSSDSKEVLVADEETIDGEIQAVLIDFETSARKSAVAEGRSLYMLYESEEMFDLDSFAADVARLVKNYDNLIDMEALLVNKSREFLVDRYGEEVASQFLEKLETQHDIEEPTIKSPLPASDSEIPLAIGAGTTGD